MGSASTVGEVPLSEIKHYGVRGMKWGVRKARIEGARSSDSANLKSIKGKGKSTKISSLSNQELQAAITRMNLEKQYSSLNQSRAAKGQKFIKGLLGIGKTANEVAAFNNSPVGTSIRDGIKNKIK